MSPPAREPTAPYIVVVPIVVVIPPVVVAAIPAAVVFIAPVVVPQLWAVAGIADITTNANIARTK